MRFGNTSSNARATHVAAYFARAIVATRNRERVERERQRARDNFAAAVRIADAFILGRQMMRARRIMVCVCVQCLGGPVPFDYNALILMLIMKMSACHRPRSLYIYMLVYTRVCIYVS